MKTTILLALVALTVTEASAISVVERVPWIDLVQASALTSDAAPVNVTLYYESLCPGCRQFITSNLVRTVKALGNDGSVFDFHFIPYGNANEKWDGSQWKFSCQHGLDECEGNLVETCAIHYKPKFKDHFEFIVCFEENFRTDWKDTLEQCGKKYNIPVSDVTSCATGDLGNKLEHEMALKTGDHQYVPWVILNGQHSPNAQTDLVSAVCKAYKGPKPKGCQ